MNCNHKQLKCTDNRFFCLICGAEIADPHEADKQAGAKENAPEGLKKPVKRKAKKEAE